MKKAYIAIKFHENCRNRDLIEKISEALEKNGIKHICMIRDHEKWGTVKFTPKELMKKTFQEMEKADVLIVEITEKGVGIGIEAGYAYAKGIPIIVIAKHGSDISNTMKGIAKEVFLYHSLKDLDDFFKKLSTFV